MAVQNGHTEVAELLIDKGADVNKPDNAGATPLWIAAHKGHTATAQLLISVGANVNQAEIDGTTPLFDCSTKWSCRSSSTIVNR